MEQFCKRAAGLLSVKSLVTLTLTAVFAALALRFLIPGQTSRPQKAET